MTIRQTGFLKDSVGQYIVKDPHAELQYGVDWKQWLELGDAVTTATWVVETVSTGTTLTASGNSILDGVALTTLVGGDPGSIYTVANTVTTDQGYIDTRRFRVRVENRFIL